jgi:hypothetical protein
MTEVRPAKSNFHNTPAAGAKTNGANVIQHSNLNVLLE